ncbi:DUF721 domain-containing protein [Saprospira grandis]|uniref:DUF721 domain-containing protein n=1 Tax=Saprospira grandis (strain Lewin) TaxID=984262 RepID=H6L874_SAPGL|nr:DUF721 domain-containing protein [Saprospira grandis]AFC25402.1 hypothetical protein SGRA_2674 [Saprospira grandis str. Lewin]WBM73461.1 DUF721 domain-containing protein [Saprospira grandis]
MKSLEDLHNSLPYRKSNDDNFGNVLGKMLQVYGLSDKMREFQIRNYWEQQMGPMIAEHTQSIFVKRRKLFVRMRSAPLRQELLYGKAKLLELLNRHLGEEYLKDVVILA